MKITLDARMYNYSGIGRYIKFLLSFLPEFYELELLAYEGEIKDDKLKIIPVKSRIYSPFEQIELKQKIKKTDIYWTPHFNVPILNIPARYRITTIHDVCHLTEHSDLSKAKKLYARMLYLSALKKSDIVFTVSNFTKNELRRIFNLNSREIDKVKVVYEAIEFKNKKINASTFPVDGKYILYVGNVKKHKNIEGLIKAFRIIKDKFSDIKLVVVGRMEKFISGNVDALRLIEENGLNSCVVFTGVLTDEELISLYRNALLFVLPSFYEGFGLPPLEAISNGCPVFLSDIEVFREIYGDCVIYCNPYDPVDIAEKIEKFIENPALFENLKEKSKKIVERFSVEIIKQNYLKHLKSLEEVAS